jgi:hypothetical protein
MTRATDLIHSAYILGMKEHAEIHEQWVATSFKIAEIAGNAHLMATQQIGRLDLMLRQIERERLEIMKCNSSSDVDITLELQMSLSTSWVLRTYEIVRAGKEQLERLGTANLKLKAIERRLAIARMPIAKGEIRGMKILANKRNPPMLVKVGDPAPMPYEADGSYIVPCSLCTATGSVVWHPVDIDSRQAVAICRRDLSGELLGIFG